MLGHQFLKLHLISHIIVNLDCLVRKYKYANEKYFNLIVKSVKKKERQISVERVVSPQESQKLHRGSSFSPCCPSSPARVPWHGSPGTLGIQTLPSSSSPGTGAPLSVYSREQGEGWGSEINGENRALGGSDCRELVP